MRSSYGSSFSAWTADTLVWQWDVKLTHRRPLRTFHIAPEQRQLASLFFFELHLNEEGQRQCYLISICLNILHLRDLFPSQNVSDCGLLKKNVSWKRKLVEFKRDVSAESVAMVKTEVLGVFIYPFYVVIGMSVWNELCEMRSWACSVALRWLIFSCHLQVFKLCFSVKHGEQNRRMSPVRLQVGDEKRCPHTHQKETLQNRKERRD